MAAGSRVGVADRRATARRYRGLPWLPDLPTPFTLTAKAEAVLDGEPGRPETAAPSEPQEARA